MAGNNQNYKKINDDIYLRIIIICDKGCRDIFIKFHTWAVDILNPYNLQRVCYKDSCNAKKINFIHGLAYMFGQNHFQVFSLIMGVPKLRHDLDLSPFVP